MRPAAVALLFALAACGEPEPIPERSVLYTYPYIETAVSDARGSLDHFWTAYNSGNDALSGFAVSIPLPGREYVTDHAWVDLTGRDGAGQAVGVIQKENPKLKGLKPGDEVTFPEGDIVDWRYRDDGKFRGAYVTRALLTDGPARRLDVDAIRALYHESPTP